MAEDLRETCSLFEEDLEGLYEMVSRQESRNSEISKQAERLAKEKERAFQKGDFLSLINKEDLIGVDVDAISKDKQKAFSLMLKGQTEVMRLGQRINRYGNKVAVFCFENTTMLQKKLNYMGFERYIAKTDQMSATDREFRKQQLDILTKVESEGIKGQ